MVRVPSTPPPSRGGAGRSEESPKGDGKNFRLPKQTGRKDQQQPQQKGPKQQKGMGGTASPFTPINPAAGQSGQASAQQAEAAAQTTSTQEAGVAKINELILAMVDKMQIGTVGGQQFASLDLSGKAGLPEAFAGSNLSLTQTNQGLVIEFSNFGSSQQQDQAFQMVQQNQQQLAQLMQSLEAKNIHVAQMQIGNHQVALPGVQQPTQAETPTPQQDTPFQQPDQEGGGQQQQEPEQGDEGPQ